MEVSKLSQRRARTSPMMNSNLKLWTPRSARSMSAIILIISTAHLLLASSCLIARAGAIPAASTTDGGGSGAGSGITSGQTGANDKVDAAQSPRNALEAELNSIVKAHYDLGGNDKRLAEAIISRLLVDNLAANEQQQQAGNAGGETTSANTYAEQLASDISDNSANEPTLSGLNGQEAARVKSYLINSFYNHEPYPMLPFSEAATMKRANTKLGLALKQRHSNGGARGALDYTYGSNRRPESDESSASDILRFGDLLSSAGTLKRPVGQFDKRPSSHRYDFGLGKRVASPTYPSRYDFGLGKRVPNYVRYDFGLGKK